MLSLGLSAFAQRTCGTTAGFNDRMANDPAYQEFYEKVVIPSETDFANANRIPCDGGNTIDVPVAFHFDETFACTDIACILVEVEDQLATLNSSFASNTGTAPEAACPAAYMDAAGNSVASTGTCITFVYAASPACSNLQECDLPITIGEFNGGLNGGGSGAGTCWSGVMNIFITSNQCLGVADGIPGAANGDGVTVCSQAFGGVGGPSGGCGSGLDDDNTFSLGYTLVHEVGHYLGLFHTFQGGCGTQETNPPGPINVLDTPAHSTPTSGCPGGCINSACGGVRPTANFMDYTDDACMSMFTEDQAAVMNYWAFQLFGDGAVQASTATTLESCEATMAVCACPTEVTVQYTGAATACMIAGDVMLPTDFSSVVSDVGGVFVWSTGGYLSAGGTATSSPYTPMAPPSCAPVDEVLFLNLTCGDDPSILLDAGTYTLTVYPDPTTFTVDDLVTFTDGACNGPSFVVNAECTNFVTVIQSGGPAFPVSTGTGSVTYDVSLNYPVECCCMPTFCTVTVPNASVVDIPDNDAANPACLDMVVTCDGPVTNVDVTVDITHTWVGDLIVFVTSPAGTTVVLGDRPGTCSGDDMVVTWDDSAAMTDGNFESTCNNLPAITGSFQPNMPLSSVNGEGAAGTWTVCVSDNAGIDTGTLNSASITVDSEAPCIDPVLCAFTGTANYVCSDCDDCADPTCVIVQGCDDNDPCTENDMESVLPNSTVCVPCAGTAVVMGCTNPAACNYDPAAVCDDGSCDLITCVDCDYVVANNIDVCQFIADNPGSPLATLDCDMGGINNITECSSNPATNPLNAGDDGDCNASNGTLSIEKE